MLKYNSFHVKWLQDFKASLLWQAFEMHSWLRVSVSFTQCVRTSRCRSALGGILVLSVQLLQCCRSFFCYDMKALLVQWLTWQDGLTKESKGGSMYRKVNIFWTMCSAHGWPLLLLQEPADRFLSFNAEWVSFSCCKHTGWILLMSQLMCTCQAPGKQTRDINRNREHVWVLHQMQLNP